MQALSKPEQLTYVNFELTAYEVLSLNNSTAPTGKRNNIKINIVLMNQQ